MPPDVPLYRTRAQRFDDLVLDAVARLEPRWEAQLTQVEFAVEEIPPPAEDEETGIVALGRLDPGTAGGTTGGRTGGGTGEATGDSAVPRGAGNGGAGRPPRIVLYRRPLLARAEGEEDLSDLVFEVVVEEFARLLGVDPEDVDPDYSPED